MENVAEALKMAGEMLLFILALGICISSFSQARETSDALLRYTDREYVTQYQGVGTTQRVVGEETVIPTIYRTYKERFKIYFYESDGADVSDVSDASPLELYTIENAQTHEETSVNAIDADRPVLGEDWQKDNFIMALLYGTNANLKDQYGNTISFDEFEASLNSGYSVYHLNPNGIYDIIIKSNRFEEYFGVYYPSQAREGAGEGTEGEEINVNAQTTSEEKMRVISYIAI